MTLALILIALNLILLVSCIVLHFKILKVVNKKERLKMSKDQFIVELLALGAKASSKGSRSYHFDTFSVWLSVDDEHARINTYANGMPLTCNMPFMYALKLVKLLIPYAKREF